MKVSIIRTTDGEIISALIREVDSDHATLPSMQEGWRFNFNKHSKEKYAETFILTCENTPNVVEGCLILKRKPDEDVYMAYIEIAPHNKGQSKQYDHVAGCLIAFACRLSFGHSDRHHKGFLAFDVMEEKEEDQLKLMQLYSQKYHAKRYENTTTMVIIPEGSKKLIDEYLKSRNDV